MIYYSADELIDHLKDYSEIKKLSPFIVGLFIIGIDPEETIASIIAAINGLPYVAVGNVIGNSIISIAFCFALPAIFYSLKFKPVNLFYPVILLILSTTILIASISQTNLIAVGLINLAIFVVYTYRNFKYYEQTNELEVKIDEMEEDGMEAGENVDVESGKSSRHLLIAIIFLILVIIGGEMLVNSAEELIAITGIDESFFGFIIIAFLTNVEEITLIIKSIEKNQEEIGVGGMIGKLIWNLGFTFGFSSLILGAYIGNVASRINGLILLGLNIHFLFILKRGKMDKKEGYIYLVVFLIFIASNIVMAVSV